MAKSILRNSISDGVRRAVTWLRVGRAVLFLGPSGCGKSESIKDQLCTALAEFHDGFDKLPVKLDLRLSYRDAVDLRGYGKVNEENGTTQWFSPAEFPTEGPGVIFIDEISQGEKAAQHSAYQLVLEGALAEYVVPEGVYIVAAGNRQQDGCGLRKLDAALRQRFAVIEVEPTASDWRENWAIENEVEESLIAATFIYPELIEGWDGKVDGQQSTARELVALSDAIKHGVQDADLLGFASDVIGETAALQVKPFISNYEGLIPLSSIYADPHGARVPDANEFDVAIQVCVAVAKNVDAPNVKAALQYVDRLDNTFRALFAKSFPILAGAKALRAQAWEDWTVANQRLTLR